MKPEDCAITTVAKVRYADTDRQSHVDNAAFSSFIETGRVELLYDPERPLAAPGAEFVIASLRLDFKGEIHWPGELRIGTWVSRLGTSSIHLGQSLYQVDPPVAVADTVVVQIDGLSRRATPLSEAARARLAALLLSPPG